jgi:hypothetical protein
MQQQRLNATRILGELARIRSAIPLDGLTPVRKQEHDVRRTEARTMEEFELEAIADAAESLAEDIHAVVEAKTQAMMEKALDVYYAAESLAREPEHAHLIEHVENMRRAYAAQYGRAIPSKEETELRRHGR